MQRLGLASELATATFEERSAGARLRSPSQAEVARPEPRPEANRHERSFERTLSVLGAIAVAIVVGGPVALLAAALAAGELAISRTPPTRATKEGRA
jgi:hypothetical protein